MKLFFGRGGLPYIQTAVVLMLLSIHIGCQLTECLLNDLSRKRTCVLFVYWALSLLSSIFWSALAYFADTACACLTIQLLKWVATHAIGGRKKEQIN